MAAQDAELKLKVSLDLGFFRQQLAGLGQAAAGYSMPVQVKFDRRAVQNELNALGASIRRRDYRLTIQTNLKAEIDQARKLAQAFADLEKGAFVSGQPKQRGSFTKSAFRGMDLADVKKLYKEAANAGLLSYDETIAKNRRKTEEALYGLGKDAIAGLLNGLKSDNEKLKTAAKNLGKDLIASTKAALGIASPSKEFKKIGEDSGEGFEQGLKSGLGEATRMGIKEMRELFRALQGEAQSGAARLQATMLAAMAGIVQLPGGRQQRGRLAQSASAINTAMTGAAAVNIGARQAGVRRQAAGAASATPAFMTALPMMFGMSERELISRLQGLYGQQYRAPSIGGARTGIPSQLSSLISSISGTRGPLGTGGGAIEQLFRGGAVNPGVLSSGYIGRSALSPKFVNYPAGMPPAYATGFIEPTAFGSLAAGTTGRYGMGGTAAFPSSPMMRGGIGAGGGSFIPMQEVAASSNRAKEAISGFTARLKNLADFVAGNQSLPISPAQQRQATAWANSTRQGNLGSRFVGPSGNVQPYAGNFPVSGMMGPFSPRGSMGQFPMAGMMYPSSPLGRITAQSSMFGGGGGNVPPGGGGGGGFGMGGFGGFGRALGGVNLPGAGTIRELGEEFGFATKQVLLFGQAYKMLGFIQSFPGQVGQAVGQLQTFRNTLGAISPTAEEAAASNRLILDLVEKYNVPLQSARDGFTKLYASMAPAGFSGDEIRNLFTGITQAAATFGMSADKVDRVNYAFAQMASKGQVMSEELKGQLGDVLPGAMALFAKAAGFEGPKAIQDFSAALEDGRYKGEAMVALLKNVGVVMTQEFGPGAEGAALTFQGIINRMQNSMTLLYESFEPVAVGFLNTIVAPLTDGIKQISDGFNAFFTGTTATTAGGGVFARQLQSMLPAIEGIKNNIAGLVPIFQQFGTIAGQVAQLLLQIAGNPVAGYFAKLYLVALPLNIAFNSLASVIRSVIGSMTALNVGLLAGSQRFTTYRILMDATGVSAARLTGILRAVAPALNLVTIGLRAIAGPVILVGISLLIERFMMLKGAIDGVGQSTKQMLAGISSMANTGAVAALKNTANDLQKQIQTFEKLRPFVSGGALGPSKQLTPEIAKTMEELGMGSFVSKTIFGKPQINDFVNASKIIEARLQGLRKAAAGVQEKLPLAERVAKGIEAQTKPTETVTPIPPGPGADKGTQAAAQSLESLESLRDQLAKARMEGDMERAKILFEYQKRLDERRFELQESGANDVQKAGIKLAKELFEVKIRFERAVFEAGAAVTRQAGSVAPGNRPPRAPKGQNAYGPITQFGAGANANLQIGQQVGGADMQRPVSGSERRDIVAAEKTQQTITTESIRLTYELKNAAEDYAQVIRQNFDAIFPVAQLQLQNQLLAARYQLELQAVPKEAIDAQLAIAEAKAKGAAMQEELDKKLEEATQTIDKYTKLQEDGVDLAKQQAYELKEAEAFVGAYAAEVGKAAAQIEAFTEAQLENAIATMKQADALKAMEEVSGRINDAVEGVTGTYKSLFKEIAMGADSVEALKKAQDALADQFLTMFFDFAMKPVEDFFKNALGGLFNIPNEEQQRKDTLSKMEAQLAEQKKIAAATQQTAINTGQGANLPGAPSGQPQAQAQAQTISVAGFVMPAGESLTSMPSAYEGVDNYFNGEVFQSITSGLGGTSLSESVQSFQNSLSTVDASIENTAATVANAGEEAGPNGSAGMKFSEALGKTVQGIGIAAGAIMGIMAGVNQIKEGGTSNVLGGIGSILLGVGGAIGGFAGMIPKAGQAANGAVWKGGFTAFANGGMVTGPTLGLIGEGKYNEAIVPLPDGKSIPVQLGGASSRELLSGGAKQQSVAPMLSMSFQTTKFGDREYVDIDQLQAAMAETRKMAARDGANRGASLALDRLQNSPSVRRKVGMR